MTAATVSELLGRHGIAHALIGAAACAVHGVTRSTEDLDLLVTDRRCLDAATWRELAAAGVAIDLRRGDADDPLQGVARLRSTDGMQIDVIVGRGGWQDDVLRRAESVALPDGALPVATAADLVLLKLYAGGPQDAWDIDQLLDAVPALEADVARTVAMLPGRCTRLWQRILAERAAD